MIVLEFLVFVISSGLFFSERFRHRIWAVLIAGGIATGSSLLFVYDLGARLMEKPEAPQVKIVKQVVTQTISQPPSLPAPQDCRDDYPWLARIFGEEGTTGLVFDVHSDGTVDNVTVGQSSGYERLDDAAIDCVKRWHYRPAIKDGKLVDEPWTASIAWRLEAPDNDKSTSAN
jgi:TonB family protein